MEEIKKLYSAWIKEPHKIYKISKVKCVEKDCLELIEEAFIYAYNQGYKDKLKYTAEEMLQK